jgi:hypothetical protein
MAQKAHSDLGASSAYRWMACPGSVRLSAGIEKTSSSYAKEGTAAHLLAESCLSSDAEPSEFLGQEIQVEGESFTVDEEMTEAVQVFKSAVLSVYDPKTDVLAIERRFDLSQFHPGMFGTCDAVVYKPAPKELHVFDFKYGKGHAVEVADNPQLKYYGLGAVIEEKVRPVSTVKLYIVQPRAPHRDGPVREWAIDIMDLIEWSGELTRAAKATEATDAPTAAGDHCGFCPALATCATARDRNLAVAAATFAASPIEWTPPAPETLTPEQLSAVLIRAGEVKDWIGAVQAHAHAEAEAGRVPPGFKLVDKRAQRRWADEEEVIKKFEVLGSATLYVEPKLRSPAQLEAALIVAAKDRNKKLTKKQAEDMVKPFVIKESSGTNLVPDTDARPEVLASVKNAFTPITSTEGALPWEQ